MLSPLKSPSIEVVLSLPKQLCKCSQIIPCEGTHVEEIFLEWSQHMILSTVQGFK